MLKKLLVQSAFGSVSSACFAFLLFVTTGVLESAEPIENGEMAGYLLCLLYTSPSPRDATLSRMPSSA